jgi:hypothetical protein
MGEGTIVLHSLKTTQNENYFQARSNKNKKSYMALLYLLIKVFLKFNPLTAPGMASCVNLGPKCQNLFALV